MASYCSFETKIHASPEKLAELIRRLGQSGIIGIEEYDDLFDEPAGLGFEWGSKWMQFYAEHELGEDSMLITGETTSHPITGLWQRISEKYQAEVISEYTDPTTGIENRESWISGEKIRKSENE